MLVDTGIGDRTTNPNFIAVFLNDRGEGRLLNEFKGAGLSPDDVDTVVLSHLHPDHVGWNLSGSGPGVGPTFPKARYLVHRDDWNAFRRPEVIGQFPFGYWEETIGPLESLGVLDLIDGEHPLTSEVTVIPTPGHTAGHVSLAIASQGQHGLVMSDVAIHPALVTEDGWASAAEMDPALAARTRREFLDRAEAENATCVRLPLPGAGFRQDSPHRRTSLLAGPLGIRSSTADHYRRCDMAECRVNVGNVEVIGLTDAEVGGRVKVTDLLPETPMEAIAPYRERYPEAFSTPDTWQAHFGCYLLRSDGKTILVDTGLGDRKSNPNTLAGLFNNEVEGRLMDELGSAGVSPTDIDTVVLTHLHSDHVGWNLVHEGGTPALRFPKAKYLIHQNDWNAFQTPDIQSRYPFGWWDDTLGPLETLSALELVSGEQVLTSEVTIIETHGHTPGHVSLAISSQGQRGSCDGRRSHPRDPDHGGGLASKA